MAEIWDLGIQVVVIIQHLGGWLLRPMEALSLIGGLYLFFAVGTYLYWCVSAEVGLRLGLLLLFSEGLNAGLKIAFHGPRPYWYSSDVKALSAESTFGLPSGHAQRAVVIWGVLAAWLRRSWAWAVAIAMMFLIGLSRVYLAVHFPTDVLLGWLLGFVLLWGLLRYEHRLTGWFLGYRWPVQVILGLLGSLLLLGLGAIALRALGDWQMPATWLANAGRAGKEPPTPLDPLGLILSTGVFFGMVSGVVLLRQRGGYAPARGDGWQKVTRYLVGLLGLSILWFGTGGLITKQAGFIAYLILYLQSTLIGIWFTGLAPLVFIRLGLAER